MIGDERQQTQKAKSTTIFNMFVKILVANKGVCFFFLFSVSQQLNANVLQPNEFTLHLVLFPTFIVVYIYKNIVLYILIYSF